MKLEITLDGVKRTYAVTADDIINTNWAEHIEDIADSIEKAELI
jgi:hypothetical protein